MWFKSLRIELFIGKTRMGGWRASLRVNFLK